MVFIGPVYNIYKGQEVKVEKEKKMHVFICHIS